MRHEAKRLTHLSLLSACPVHWRTIVRVRALFVTLFARYTHAHTHLYIYARHTDVWGRQRDSADPLIRQLQKRGVRDHGGADAVEEQKRVLSVYTGRVEGKFNVFFSFGVCLCAHVCLLFACESCAI